MLACRTVIVVLLLVRVCFALEPSKANLESIPKLIGNEIILGGGVPYLGGRQSPGDLIGTTWFDLQAIGSFGQRIFVDSDGTAYMFWTKLDAAQSHRCIAFNIRYPDGSYYGETQAAPSWSGYVQVDGTKIYSEKPVIVYNSGGIWLLIWEGQSVPIPYPYVWPYVAVTSGEDVIVVAAGDYNIDAHHLVLTTDGGNTWTSIADFDSCATLSQFVRASRKPGSNKIVFVHTQFITDTIAGGQLDQDVYYTISTDGGVTWGPHINITNYQSYPTDSVRAYCNVNAVFDNNNNLHIVWAGRRVTDNYYEASKIFHWDEVSNNITVVNSPSTYYTEPGGWWITVTGAGDPGAWRMPADQPQLVIDTVTGYLYCLWHGNDDYNDGSAAGYFNGEFYGSYSTDNGLTWSDYVNLTNTRCPGAPAGACYDEDYMTAFPYVFNDTIFITYIEDKDAGSVAHTEGVFTENPVRCWVFHMSYGIEEEFLLRPEHTVPMLEISPNPFKEITNLKFQIPSRVETRCETSTKSQIIIKIYDSSGRLVRQFDYQTVRQSDQISWNGTDNFGHEIPAGVYFVQLKIEDGSITKKIIKLK